MCHFGFILVLQWVYVLVFDCSDNNQLHFGSIVCMLGTRYKSYCSNVVRTMMVEPSAEMQANYDVLLRVEEEILNKLQHGMFGYLFVCFCVGFVCSQVHNTASYMQPLLSGIACGCVHLSTQHVLCYKQLAASRDTSPASLSTYVFACLLSTDFSIAYLSLCLLYVCLSFPSVCLSVRSA